MTAEQIKLAAAMAQNLTETAMQSFTVARARGDATSFASGIKALEAGVRTCRDAMAHSTQERAQ